MNKKIFTGFGLFVFITLGSTACNFTIPGFQNKSDSQKKNITSENNQSNQASSSSSGTQVNSDGVLADQAANADPNQAPVPDSSLSNDENTQPTAQPNQVPLTLENSGQLNVVINPAPPCDKSKKDPDIPDCN